MSLATEDTHFVIYMNAKDPALSQGPHSREDLAPVFAELNKYYATAHFVGQSTLFTFGAQSRNWRTLLPGPSRHIRQWKESPDGRLTPILTTPSRKSIGPGSLPSACCTSTGWKSGHCRNCSQADQTRLTRGWCRPIKSVHSRNRMMFVGDSPFIAYLA